MLLALPKEWNCINPPDLKPQEFSVFLSLKHEAAVSPGKAPGRHLRWMQEAGMWGGWGTASTRHPHSGNTPSSPFSSFHSPASCPTTALLSFPRLGSGLILLPRGRALQSAAFSGGWRANTEGGRRPALAKAPLWHILTWPLMQSNHPRPQLESEQRGFFNEFEMLSQKFQAYSLYKGTSIPACTWKHNYTIRNSYHTFSRALRFGII